MNPTLLIIGALLLGVAGVIHVLIFVLESVLWSRESVWRLFGLRTAAGAAIVRPMAFNQGFYNLFLAVGITVGLVLILVTEAYQAGIALLLASGSSMVLAAMVLIVSSPKLARAAAIQGTAPLVGVALVTASLVS
ncbi:MAG: DUF1304 domain-containing protein [Salinibacterium sp.]|nr:DUF1304 domain-containing protein [Salinibacterium sp.]